MVNFEKVKILRKDKDELSLETGCALGNLAARIQIIRSKCDGNIHKV
jgi:hypothetical protein